MIPWLIAGGLFLYAWTRKSPKQDDSQTAYDRPYHYKDDGENPRYRANPRDHLIVEQKPGQMAVREYLAPAQQKVLPSLRTRYSFDAGASLRNLDAKFKKNPPRRAGLAIHWLFSVFRDAESAGVYKIELVAEDSASLLTKSAVGFLADLEKGFRNGGLVGAAVQMLMNAINSLNREVELEGIRNKLAELFGEYMEAYGPPPVGLLIYAENAKIVPPEPNNPESWFRYLLEICTHMRERGWNTNAFDPNVTGTWFDPKFYKSSDHVVLDGDWKAVKPRSRIQPWYMFALHFKWLLGEVTFPSNMVGYNFYDKLAAELTGKRDIQFFDLTHETLLKVYSAYGAQPPAIMRFRVGMDPGTLRFIDLFDFTDLIPKGGGSISVPVDQWARDFTIYTRDGVQNWLVSMRSEESSKKS